MFCRLEGATLPGGDIPDLDLDRYSRDLAARYPVLPADLLSRLVHTYGSRTDRLSEGATTLTDLGDHFGGTLYAREVDYLVANEWACTAEDVLFRRTKLGLRLPEETVDRLREHIASKLSGFQAGQ